MVLIVVLAVMSGFETSLKEKILGINSHIWILPQTTQYIEGYQDIVARMSAYAACDAGRSVHHT